MSSILSSIVVMGRWAISSGKDICSFMMQVTADQVLAEDLKRYGRMNIMFVPINGHDWKRFCRDIMGNMDYREALDLCDYVGTDLVVPMHYDLFGDNTDNPAYFVDYLYREYSGQKFKMFMPGETLLYRY